MTRIDRLRRLIEEPLLVTMPVNVFYLTGFRSSNAALLVDDERALLFSDFRYAEAGRRVDEVEFIEVERALVRGVAAHVEGRMAFERTHLTYASWDFLNINAGDNVLHLLTALVGLAIALIPVRDAVSSRAH